MSPRGETDVDSGGRLPDFLGIGAQRCATTWLFENLRDHPALYLPEAKELDFFSSASYSGASSPVAEYRSVFSGAIPGQKCGEISTEYLISREAPRRIRRLLGSVRLITLVRDPVERAFSSYSKRRRDGEWDRSFEEFVAQNIDLCVKRGFYHRQIRRYLDFHPRERILIEVYDDIESSPERVLASIHGFLGVEHRTPEQMMAWFNVGDPDPGLLARAAVKGRDSVYAVPGGRWAVKALQRQPVVNRLLEGLFRNSRSVIPSDLARDLAGLYWEDVEGLSRLLERDLVDEWLVPYRS